MAYFGISTKKFPPKLRADHKHNNSGARSCVCARSHTQMLTHTNAAACNAHVRSREDGRTILRVYNFQPRAFPSEVFPPNFLHNFPRPSSTHNRNWLLENHTPTFPLGFFLRFYAQHQPVKSSPRFESSPKSRPKRETFIFSLLPFLPSGRRQTIRFHLVHCYGIVVPLVLRNDFKSNPAISSQILPFRQSR